jgi:hypothetical protein
MNLFITDNVLRVDRVLKLSKNGFEPGSIDNLPSIDCTKANIKTLYKNRISFVLDLGKKEEVPDYVKLVEHPDWGKSIRWYVPKYDADNVSDQTYSVEYANSEGLDYKTGMSAEEVIAGVSSGFDIRRVVPETGTKLPKKMLRKLGMRKIKKNNFVYAVPDNT